MRIIDCFTYTGNVEVVELRVRLLQDVIDKFVIAEADHYYNGVYKGFSLKSKLKELGLYSDKIEVVEVKVPPFKQEANSKVRERLQRNSLSAFINLYDVAIFSECEEIIKPELVLYYVNVAQSHPHALLRIPMQILGYKANLITYDLNDQPICSTSAFICMKHHVEKYTLSEISEQASLNLNFDDTEWIYITQDNNILVSGWDFSGAVTTASECNHKNTIFKEFPQSELPKILLEDERLFSFFIGDKENTFNDILNRNPFLNTDKNSVFFKKFSDKWPFHKFHSYIENFYENEFSRFRNRKDVKLLEIGINTSGSIVIWSKYFNNGTIVSIDNSYSKLEDTHGQWNFDNVAHIFTDAYNRNLSRSLGKFDIIIDDGPQNLETKIKFVEYYLENLNPGGIMIIEDIPETKWIEQLVLHVDTSLLTEVVDLRETDNTSDSLILIIRK